MQSEDRVIDLLRAFVKEEAPADLWQVVSSDIANVLRKIIAVSAEGQRAKLELHELKKRLERLEENSSIANTYAKSYSRHNTQPGRKCRTERNRRRAPGTGWMFSGGRQDRHVARRHQEALPALVQGLRRTVAQRQSQPGGLPQAHLPLGAVAAGQALSKTLGRDS